MTIRENLLKAIELVEIEDTTLIDLYQFAKEHPCGTMHCTLGLCATDEFFQAQGIEMHSGGISVRGEMFGMQRNLPEFFGKEAWNHLFMRRAWGTWDERWLDPEDGDITDKELALLRLNKQLEEYPE